MGKKSRTKGAAYEQELARLFREYGWTEAKRHLEFQDEEAEEGRDLDGTQPFAIQAKCWATTPSITAIQQVVTSEEYIIPVAILKRSKVGQKPLEVAVLPLRIFMEMAETIKDLIKMDWLVKETWQDIVDVATNSGVASGADE